jgi:hypothetical protein
MVTTDVHNLVAYQHTYVVKSCAGCRNNHILKPELLYMWCRQSNSHTIDVFTAVRTSNFKNLDLISTFFAQCNGMNATCRDYICLSVPISHLQRYSTDSHQIWRYTESLPNDVIAWLIRSAYTAGTPLSSAEKKESLIAADMLRIINTYLHSWN